MKLTLKTSIGRLWSANLISSSTYKILNRKNLRDIESIIKYTNGDFIRLMNLRDFEQKNINELEGVLHEFCVKEIEQTESIYEEQSYGEASIPLSDKTSIGLLFESKLISVRTFNVFNYYELLTIGDIKEYCDGDETKLLNLRNFGRKSFLEIQQLLKRVDKEIHLREEALREDATGFREIISLAYEMTFMKDNNLSATVRNLFPQPDLILKAISENKYDFLTIHSDLGRDGNIQLRSLYLTFIERIIDEIDRMNIAHSPLYYKLMSLHSTIFKNVDRFSLLEEVDYFLTPIQKTLLSRSYDNLSNSLSVRALHFLWDYMPKYRDAIPYFDKHLYEYNEICPGHTMRKTLNDIYNFVSKFKTEFYRIYNLSSDEVEQLNVVELFPYLSSEEVLDVSDYKKENGNYPLFYIVYKYLKQSTNRTDYIFSLQNGIADGTFHTLQDIASLLNITRERVRQLTLEKLGMQESDIIANEDWNSYSSLFSLKYLTELSPKYRMVKEEEQLPYDFDIFSRILPLVAPFKRFIVNGKIILVNECLIQGWNLNNIFKLIDNVINDKYSSDTHFYLQNFIYDVPKDFKEDALGLLTYVISEAYNVKLNENGTLTMKKNTINVSRELYNILKENKKPMHIDELFDSFKKMHPHHKFNDSKYLRQYIIRNPHIRPIGMTSTYALDSWNVYFGGVRDRLREILGQAKEPLFVDDIVKKVLKVIPYTNRASIISTMDSSDFVAYKQDRWGLANKQYDEKFQPSTIGRQRKGFDERLDEFKNFVATYHRFPFTTGGEIEQTLVHWLHNVRYGIFSITDQQKNEFNKVIEFFRENHYPETTSEYKCHEKCEEYKEYIEQNFELPTRKGNEDLYNWMFKMKRDYNSLSENNRHYITELFNYIKSYGFSI